MNKLNEKIKAVKNEQYERVYKIIEEFDPIGIAFVSDDEYAPEARDIANRCGVLEEDELADYIYEVFKFWFGAAIVPKKKEMYSQMAHKIKAIANE